MKSFIKNIYDLIPFKKQVFSFLKFIWMPPKAIYKHLHFKGIIKIKVDNNAQFRMHHYGFSLENEIFWNGLYKGWEKESTTLWIKLCRISDVILDIGANTGLYSLIAKSVNPGASVYAFEPVERVFRKLQANIALNAYSIQAEKAAVSNANGKAVIYDTPSEHVYSVTVNQNLASAGTKVIPTEIETVTLNTYLKNQNISKVDLLKIDVETHEPEVLEGFSDFLVKDQPTMLIEVLNENVARRISEIIKGIPYLCFNIDERGGIRQTETIGKSDYYNFLLCKKETAQALGLIR